MVRETPCGVDGCDNGGRKAGLCWAHYKRRQRGRPLSPPIAHPPRTWSESLTRAALKYADVESEDDHAFLRARDALRRQALTFARRRQKNRKARRR
jgi:hypothetical protein